MSDQEHEHEWGFCFFHPEGYWRECWCGAKENMPLGIPQGIVMGPIPGRWDPSMESEPIDPTNRAAIREAAYVCQIDILTLEVGRLTYKADQEAKEAHDARVSLRASEALVKELRLECSAVFKEGLLGIRDANQALLDTFAECNAWHIKLRPRRRRS